MHKIKNNHFILKHDPFTDVSKKDKIKTLKSLGITKKMTDAEINLQYFLKSQLYLFLNELNDTQMNVVLHKNGSILCSAVPGAGKTKTLVYKVAYLIEHCKIDPNRILVITFTKKAANEIKERIEQILSGDDENDLDNSDNSDNQIVSGTFHSICHRFLKSLGIIKNMTHIDDTKQQMIIEEIINNMSKTDNTESAKFIKAMVKNSINEIAKAKNQLLSPSDLSVKYGEGLISQIYEKYEQYLIRHNYIDYDDLLVKFVKEIKNNDESKNYLENRFDYVFVDEFQDTNFLQFEIVSCFARKSNNITIVGDSDQSIYGWRFADSSNIKKFQDTFKNHTVYILDQSYRSTQHIINCANSVIQQEKGRINNKIITNNENGDKVALHEFIDIDSEAKYICTKIKLCKFDFSNIAILLRTNHQSRIFEENLTKMKIPFQLVGCNNFYKSDEIQFVMSYLKFIINKKDTLSFRSIIEIYGDDRDSICKTLDTVGWKTFIESPYDSRLCNVINIITHCTNMISSKSAEPFEIVKYIIDKTNLFEMMKSEYGENAVIERWENIGELMNLSQQYESIETFLIDLVVTENGKQLSGPKVTILTVHSSKGLEWDVVFVPSIVESLIPHFMSIDEKNTNSTAEISEERRLLYVAMTRAKKKLYLSYCRTIKKFGRKEVVQISRFLKNLPQESIILTKV